MKKQFFFMFSALAVALPLSLSLQSCGDDDDDPMVNNTELQGSGNPDEKKPAITLNKHELTLEIGSSERLVASFEPIDTENKAHEWSSSNTSVATVDETGLVTAVAEGEAKIQAKALAGGRTDYCTVSVVEAPARSPERLYEGDLIEKSSSGFGFSKMTVGSGTSADWPAMTACSSTYSYTKTGDKTATLTSRAYQSSTGRSWSLSMKMEFYSSNYGKYTASQSCSTGATYTDNGYFKFSGVNVAPTEMLFNDLFLLIENPQNDKIPGNAVDLGLSVLWSDRNVGALETYDIGYEYSWGEVDTKISFWEYKLDLGKMDISGTEYDVAHVKWGGKWRMPTRAECDELAKNTKLSRSLVNGRYLYRLTASNGNYISIMSSTDYIGGTPYECILWTSTPYNEETSFYFIITSIYSIQTHGHEYSWRRYGYPIRPVCDK